MSTQIPAFKDIHSLTGSLMAALDSAASSPMKFDAIENWLVTGYMCATTWISIELAQAMLDGTLDQRLVKLIDELNTLREHLRGDGFVTH